MMRSIERRPAIAGTTFDNLREIRFDGEETGAFDVDLRRFGRVMTAIAQAIHYHDFGGKIRYWHVFCPSLQTLSAQPDGWEPLRRTVQVTRYAYQHTAYPKVFSYGRAVFSKKSWALYQFVFYDALIVNAWPSKRQFR